LTLMIKRWIALFFLVLAAIAILLTAIAEPADARKIPPLIGCDSLLNWPCPGPVLVNP
jgi:hypothetical protein